MPCRERGGGVQHAELTPQAKQLAAWGIDVGTILTALPFEQALDPARDHWRLKEIILEVYLAEAKRGWIYTKAVSYRGARQIEDEEKAGRALLTRLLANNDWTRKNYFLAQQLVATLPHGVAERPQPRQKRVRNLATALADLDPRFQPVRAKIHSVPSVTDISRVEEYSSLNVSLPPPPRSSKSCSPSSESNTRAATPPKPSPSSRRIQRHRPETRRRFQ